MMSEFSRIHTNCGLTGLSFTATGVMLLMNNVSDDSSVYQSVLEAVCQKVPAHALCSIAPDFSKSIFKLYLHSIEYACELLRKGISVNDRNTKVLPLFAHFTISNVHPSLQNSFLMEFFSTFGTVVKVDYVFACPNSATFGHVLTDKRCIVFELPSNQNFVLPKTISLVHNNLLSNINVEKFCSACMTTGHEIIGCPDMVDANSAFNISLNTSIQDAKVMNGSSVSNKVENGIAQNQFIHVKGTNHINVKKLIKIVKILNREQKLRKKKKKKREKNLLSKKNQHCGAQKKKSKN